MITKEMSIGEVPTINETTAPIMMEYGMHCKARFSHASADTELLTEEI